MDILRSDTHRQRKKMCNPEATVKLVNSVSDQNVFFTYVCTVSNIKPEGFERQNTASNYLDGETEEIDDEDPPIQVERSKALHELVESHKHDKHEAKTDDSSRNDDDLSTPYATATTSGDESEFSDNENIMEKNPNILKLTKMKWLTEDQPGSPDSSSPNVTPVLSSTSSNCSRESYDELTKSYSSDKYLSTILRLDKEHNLFGLSNIAIVGSRPSRKIRNQDERPVFHQTAIVQICCGSGCCRHTSKTDLPSSLKCPTCRPCCIDSPFCASCNPVVPPSPSSCPPCPSPCCAVNCTSCFGLKISVSRKPKYEQSPIEITPRSSCILQKPIAARPCNHCPQCVPPSSCFPYLMPCFWPSRAGAPCNTPTRCFHNPPCRAPRRPKSQPAEVCPPKCEDKSNKCGNKSCPGSAPKSGKGRKHGEISKKKSNNTCECSLPSCTRCFVVKPEGYKSARPKSGDAGQC